MSAPEPPDDEDARAFAEAMRGVRSRPPAAHLPVVSTPPPARPLQSAADEQAVLAELLDGPDPDSFESGDTVIYRGEGVPDATWRRLRRGQFRLDAELDLHGLNRERAREALGRFLAEARERDWRCLRVIHGKGNGSPNSGPVLKRAVDGWLRRHRPVLAYCSALPHHGGTGALYVLLRGRG